MAADTPARHVYKGTGSQRVFPIPTKIIGDDYVRIEIDSIHISDRTLWDIVNNSIIFVTAPINDSIIDIQVATSEEALSLLGSSTNVDIVAGSIINVNTLANNINTLVSVDNILDEIVSLESIKNEIITLFNDKTTLDGLYSSKTAIDTLYGIKAKLDSLYADKTTLDGLYSIKAKLDSLYADKTTLDGLYSSKTAIDTLYGIKAKLDSLYTDKTTLDGLYSSKTAIDTLYSIKAKLDSLYADKTTLDGLYTNLSSLISVYNNITAILSISNNISDINYFADKYLGSKTIAPTVRNDGTQLQQGDLYFNSSTVLMNVWSGSSWSVAYASLDTYTKTEIKTSLPNIGFDTTSNIVVSTAQVAWNDTEKTLDLGLNTNVTLQIGQEEVILAKNSSGSTILNGRVVMATGTNGASGNILIGLHDGTSANAMKAIGLTTEDIANASVGFVTRNGKVRGINTTGSLYGETWVNGDILYVKPGGSGALTKVVPTDLQLKMPIAFVINAHATNGTLYVRTTGIDDNKYIQYVGTLSDFTTALG